MYASIPFSLSSSSLLEEELVFAYMEGTGQFEFVIKKSVIGYYVQVDNDEDDPNFFGFNKMTSKRRIKLNDYWQKNELENAINLSKEENKKFNEEQKQNDARILSEFEEKNRDNLNLIQELLKYDKNKFTSKKAYLKTMNEIEADRVNKEIDEVKKLKIIDGPWWLSSSKEIKTYMYLITGFCVLPFIETYGIINEYADDNLKYDKIHDEHAKINLENKFKKHLESLKNKQESKDSCEQK